MPFSPEKSTIITSLDFETPDVATALSFRFAPNIALYVWNLTRHWGRVGGAFGRVAPQLSGQAFPLQVVLPCCTNKKLFVLVYGGYLS